MTSDRLLGMISHSYAKAWGRHDDSAAILARQLSESLGQKFEPTFAVKGALAVQRVRTQSDGSQAAFERLLEAIREELGLRLSNEARKVLVPLLEYSDTNEEHQITVLLTAALSEQLFNELLKRMLVHSGKDREAARGAVKALRNHRDREKAFAGLAGVSLEEVITQSGFSGFYTDWQEVRELRNKFMHGMPFIIHMSDAEKAFELAKDTFRVFAHLHIEFCLSDA